MSRNAIAMHISRCHRRAFATVTAVALIGVVGAILAMLAGLLASQVRRNIGQSEDAQLRQLLVAGELAARQSLGRSEAGPVNVPLPAELQSAGMSLSFEILARSGTHNI